MATPKSTATRRVLWDHLPLGCVVVDWPPVYGSGIAELLSYPVLTEQLRAQLRQRYQLLKGRTVTIVDPDATASTLDPVGMIKHARDLHQKINHVADFNRWSRRFTLGRSDARQGLLDSLQYEQSPYTLVKDWMRSISTILRQHEDLASRIIGTEPKNEPLGQLIGSMFAGQFSNLIPRQSHVDIAIDVSFSMISSGKACLALGLLLPVIANLASRLGLSTWQVWLLADRAVPFDWTRYTRNDGSEWRFEPLAVADLESLIRQNRLNTTSTQFAPYLQQVLQEHDRRDTGTAPFRHLCLLVTDGDCADRDLSLRLLEKIAKRHIDYAQLILHTDSDYKTWIDDPNIKSTDNIVIDSDKIKPEHRKVLSGAELERVIALELGKVTDLAEAAHGGQLIVTWQPLFQILSLDLYQHWLLSS